jgi:hypothetical protein
VDALGGQAGQLVQVGERRQAQLQPGVRSRSPVSGQWVIVMRPIIRTGRPPGIPLIRHFPAQPALGY